MKVFIFLFIKNTGIVFSRNIRLYLFKVPRLSQKNKKAASLNFLIRVFTPNIEIARRRLYVVKIIKNSPSTFLGHLNAIFPLSFHGVRICSRD